MTSLRSDSLEIPSAAMPAGSAARASRWSPAKATSHVSRAIVFLGIYIACQLALLAVGSTSLRAPTRVGAFSASLIMLLLAGRSKTPHPSSKFLALAMLSMLPGLLHPEMQSYLAALAQFTLYAAVFAPLLWVGTQPMSFLTFRRVILILWAFSVCSAVLGALQVFYPAIFANQLSAVVENQGKAFIGSLTITLGNGERVLRPMGLTDNPGGAASGAMYSILFGCGLMLTERRLWLRAAAVAGMFIGLFVIYLTYVRMIFLTTALGVLFIGVTLIRRGEWKSVAMLATVAVAVAVAGTSWAFAVGGEKTIERFSTLIDGSPAEVYAQNRGYFLQDTFSNVIYDYPLGAGPGRWGMMRYYFGAPSDSGLWAEIMWTAWLYDGGIPYLLLACAMIFVALLTSWRFALSPRSTVPLAVWAAVVFAYDFGAVAGTFSGPIFATQSGMELWFLNACLYSTCVTSVRASENRSLLGGLRTTEA